MNSQLRDCKQAKLAGRNTIIIILHFGNVAFFHAKLGLDVCPRVDNQTSGLVTLYKV